MRKDNSIDILGTMKLRKTIFLYTILSFCLPISVGRKISLTREGAAELSDRREMNTDQVSGKKRRKLTRRKEGRGKPKMFC